MSRVKVSNKHQIAVPSTARKRLQIHAGDYLLVEIRENSILLIPEPDNYSEVLRGLYGEIWEGIDAQEYVRGEREAWER